MPHIYTIGYQGCDINEFVDTLNQYRIHRIIDVREYPISRKKGFSKNILCDILQKNGVRYSHFAELGSPKSIRSKLYENGDYASFFQLYRIHANSMLGVVVEALKLSENERCCLLCYEKDYATCHRSVLSEMICDYSASIDGVVNLVCCSRKEEYFDHRQNVPSSQPAL